MLFSKLGTDVHVDHPRLDTTFCGAALEGETDVEAAVSVKEQRVTCEDCLFLIEFAKQIPARLLKKGTAAA